MSDKTLMVDGDIVLFTTAISTVQAVLWKDDIYTEQINLTIAIDKIDGLLEDIRKKTQSDRVIIAFSSSEYNFRKKLVSCDYKGNRKFVKKPCGYALLKEYIEENYLCYEAAGLEADDILGLLATTKGNIKGDKAIWSYDKDFKSVPCSFFRQAPKTGEMIRYDLTRQEADYNFLIQVLAGDTSDGYLGCKGVGATTAPKILPSLNEFTLKAGWDAVIAAYIKAGQTEHDAITSARLARLLQKGDYDFKERKINLWNPPL